jgi:hypothetical protein
VQVMGYDDSVQLASAFAQARGYEEMKLQEVTQPTIYMYHLEFGIEKKDGKSVLKIDVDRTLRKVVKAEEASGVAVKILETP